MRQRWRRRAAVAAAARDPLGPPAEAAGRGGAGHRAGASGRPARRRRIWVWAGSVVLALVLAVTLVGYGIDAKLTDNLKVVHAFTGLKHRPTAAPPGVQNILVLGSQTRDGQIGGKALFGTDPGTNLSDNLILVHLYAGGTHAAVVSIPRDTMVYEPACRAASGHGVVPARQQAIIDGAMNVGGPACAVATVEHLTGIRVDHFVEFDFNSFRTLTDVIGGVEVCLPQAVDDPYSHLHLSAGRHLVEGDTALAFVRTRHGVGDGSDLGRIELQQEFMSSLIQKVLSQGTLENPVELFRIADTATKALTVDPGLGSVQQLLGLAASLRHLHAKDIEFLTMPTVSDPADPNRLLPAEPEDDLIWQLLRTGAAWPGHLPVPPPRQVAVRVLNGGGPDGQAAQTAAALRKLGFHVVSVGNAPGRVAVTTIAYRRAQAGAATAVADALDAVPATEPAAANGSVTLTIGPGFAGVHAPPVPAARGAGHGTGAAHGSAGSGPGAVQTRNAGQGICSDLPAANPNPGRPG